ncbi:MAG: hypothetical protein NT091_03050 [Candidatus Falkowbacteria bacterium]|nr:hypothetical protein [Candidatus Falkowbacteria bacterium]
MKKTKSANKQYFLIEQSNNFKDVYDFMAQYASGQVQIYNQKTLKADVFNPDYVNSCILFLITKENILNLKSQGYDLISLAGITYQI